MNEQRIGHLLWMDADPDKSLLQKIVGAARAFEKKHGLLPAAVMISDHDWPEKWERTVAHHATVDGIEIRVESQCFVLRHHCQAQECWPW